MPENPRIDELRRRVQKDPASIAFAQLAEEYRRAGRFQEAVETCHTGLSHHPGYLSAHVTLGRALIELGDLQTAHTELTGVLGAAPENLAALRGLAEIHHRRGELPAALGYYRRALEFARHDPDLEHVVSQITRELEPAAQPRVVPDGLSFEEAMDEFRALSARDAPSAASASPPATVSGSDAVSGGGDVVRGIDGAATPAVPWALLDGPSAQDDPTRDADRSWAPPHPGDRFEVFRPSAGPPVSPPAEAAAAAAPAEPASEALEAGPSPVAQGGGDGVDALANRQLAALERWLDAVIATRHRPAES